MSSVSNRTFVPIVSRLLKDWSQIVKDHPDSVDTSLCPTSRLDSIIVTNMTPRFAPTDKSDELETVRILGTCAYLLPHQEPVMFQSCTAYAWNCALRKNVFAIFFLSILEQADHGFQLSRIYKRYDKDFKKRSKELHSVLRMFGILW